MTGRTEENDMGRKKQISDQKRLHRERMRLQKGVFSSLATVINGRIATGNVALYMHLLWQN